MPHKNKNKPAETVTAGTRQQAGWYTIRAAKEANEEAEIRIYEEIGGFGITANQFVRDLAAIDAKTIRVRLNTPGGDVFDGTAIHNALRAHPATIIIDVEGVAASAGSFIAMSGDEVRMADNAYMMIHNSAGGVYGGADDLSSFAALLEKVDGNIAQMYAGKSGKKPDHYRELMNAETWFTADEAKAEGLVDDVYAAEPREPASSNRFDFKVYNKAKIPAAALAAYGRQSDPEQPPEASPRGDPVPAIPQPQESLPMSEANAPAAPAQAPSPANNGEQQGKDDGGGGILNLQNAPLIRARIDKEREAGRQAGRTEERDRMKAIFAACPERPQMAIDAFLAGQTPGAVKMAYESAKAEENRRLDAEAAYTKRIERLEALLEIGGHPGVETALAADADGDGEGVTMNKADAEVRASDEWERQPKLRRGFSAKENYVAFRARQLTGRA